MMLPILALLCSRAFRLRAIRTTLALQTQGPRTSSLRSTTNDPRQPCPEQASEACMTLPYMVPHCARAFRSPATRTTLALQIRSSTRPSSPRHGDDGRWWRRSYGAVCGRTEDVRRAPPLHVSNPCGTKGCPTKHARRTSAPCLCTQRFTRLPHTMRRCAPAGDNPVRRGAVELPSTPP
jgi:hypothetical protein